MIEINIDGIVGPTHHFGGLGVGNVASMENQAQVSHPRQAALEGLQKAWLVASLGVPQFVFLPVRRPCTTLLAQMGFGGSITEQVVAANLAAPRALSASYSSAFMWMANAATITPGCDSADGRLHCTPANLISSLHRASEASERAVQFESLFMKLNKAKIHKPLPATLPLRDEGAANHMRLCGAADARGFNIFTYGVDEDATSDEPPRKYWARHTLAASQAVARLHQLKSDRTYFLRQHPRSIDAGVFHNDVIATSCDHMLLHHEFAFVSSDSVLQRLEADMRRAGRLPLLRIEIADSEFPLADAVRSYFFNSQIVKPMTASAPFSAPRYVLICPHHCQEIESASNLIKRLIADTENPIEEVKFVRLAESMANGGGPACLRLRAMLSEDEIQRLNPKLQLTEKLFDQLSAVVGKFYLESLTARDFCQPEFIEQLARIELELMKAIE